MYRRKEILRNKESKLFELKNDDEGEEGEDEEEEDEETRKNKAIEEDLLLREGAEHAAKRKEILRKLKLQLGGTMIPPTMTFLPSSEEMQRLIKKAIQVKSIKELNV